MQSLKQRMQEIEDVYIGLRRRIHQHPEIGFKEYETTKLIKQELASYGIEVYENGNCTGVIGVLKGDLPGKTVALRADIDALPVQEETGLPFASEVPGRCHACGHDIHMSTLLAAARLLSERKASLRGTVKFIFQPAEEKLNGSESIIQNGFLDDVEAIFGAHTWPDVPGGSIGIKKGTMMAGSDAFKIRLTAKGGHAAHPHKTPDPIVAAAYMITQLQTITSRELNPLDSAVVTVGKLLAGTAGNVIPSEVVLEGTMRYLQYDTRKHIQESIKRITEGAALSMRVGSAVEFAAGGGPVIGTDALVDTVGDSVRSLLGEDHLYTLPAASMGSEDFARYLEKIPGAFFRLGTGDERPETHLPLHNGHLLFSEKAIASGAVTFCGIVYLYTGSDFSILK